MKTSYKLRATRAAIRNIWAEHYFVFDPGVPSNANEFDIENQPTQELQPTKRQEETSRKRYMRRQALRKIWVVRKVQDYLSTRQLHRAYRELSKKGEK